MTRTDLVQCQGCHGEGGYKEVILDDGSGPWEPCGYCKNGRTTKMMNAWIMRWGSGYERWFPSDVDIELHAATMKAFNE